MGEIAEYIKDISRTHIELTDDELHEAVAGNDWDTVFRATAKLVVRIASEWRPFGVSLADAVQEGNLVLHDAIRCFDPDYGTPFRTYVFRTIKNKIADMGMYGLIRIPVQKYRQRAKITWDRRCQIDARPDNKESPVKVIDDLDAVKFIHRLCDEAIKDSPESVGRKIHIARRSFGVGQQERDALVAMSQEMNITRERVRQLKEDGLIAVRQFAEERKIDLGDLLVF